MPKTNRIKVCACCGKSAGTNWAQHWKSKHPNAQKTELRPGETPAAPFHSDWINKIKCKKTREIFKEAITELPPLRNETKDTIKSGTIPMPSIPKVPLEESKGSLSDESVQLEIMTTGQLFQYAIKILTLIDGRLGQKEVKIQNTIDFLSRETATEQEICIRPLYRSHNGCRLTLGKIRGPHDNSSGHVTISSNEVLPLQITQRPRIDHQITRAMSRLQGEQAELGLLQVQMRSSINSVRQLTLPVILSIADGEPVDIEVKKETLKPRLKKLLSKELMKTHILTIKQAEGKEISIKQEQNLHDKNKSDTEMALLHEQLRVIEAKPVVNQGCPEIENPLLPVDIKVSEIESGDDLTEGVLAVDGARFLLCKLAQDLKGISFAKIKNALLSLIRHWRNFLKSQLQYFLNMLLVGHVGYGNNKVRLLFDGSWLEQRVFTVSVSAKEGRMFNHRPSKLLQNIKYVTEQLIESASQVRSMVSALQALKIAPSEKKLLRPSLKQVTDAVGIASDERDMRLKHRHQQLQMIMIEITKKLRDPDLIADLKDEVHSKEFWASVDLKAYARWQVIKKEGEIQ